MENGIKLLSVNELPQLNINSYQTGTFIKNSTGNLIDINSLPISDYHKKFALAACFRNMKWMYDNAKDQYKNAIGLFVGSALIHLNSKISEASRKELMLQFAFEIHVEYPNITLKECQLIVHMGIRGNLNPPDELLVSLSITNFSKWHNEYLKLKSAAMCKVIESVNNSDGLDVDSKTEIDYSFQIEKFNKILPLRKNNPAEFKKQLEDYTSYLPKILFDALVQKKYLKENQNLTYMQTAKDYIRLNFDKNSLKDKISEVVSAKDFETGIEGKIINKSYQLAVIQFLTTTKKSKI